MDIAARVTGRGFQAVEIEQIIIGFEKADLPIITALDDVLWHIDEIEAGQAWHVAGSRQLVRSWLADYQINVSEHPSCIFKCIFGISQFSSRSPVH